MFASKYFNLGQVVVTHGINNIMTKNERFALEVALSLRRFYIKDFGNLSEEDKQVNEIERLPFCCTRVTAEQEVRWEDAREETSQKTCQVCVSKNGFRGKRH